MTDRTEAMDNLIAQDADLIDTNDKDSAVLLPCPFCGGVQIEAFHHIDRGWGASWHVECVAEECGNSTCHHDTEAAAIAAWNNRQPTQSDAVVKLLETMRERCTHPCRSEKAELGCDCDAARQAAAILRQPKALTVTVVSAYDRKTVNTFKINPAEKTYVRPDHSMFGYVFEPEDDANDRR